jgi:chemotaxis methyl-accepting protein methylase
VNPALVQVAALVHRETGIALWDTQLPSLAAALARIAPDMDADRFLVEVTEGGTADALLGRLVEEVTVKETYFFREPHELTTVNWRQAAARAMGAGAKLIHVWVSACATGEEAYSMAILACEALGTVGPPISVLGTDISAHALAQAEAASYSERSMRTVSPDMRERYFIQEGRRYRVRDSLKSLVRFRRHNLVKDPAPPAGEVPFDVIACRNVLIYFDHAVVDKVIRSLESALRADGTLILGVADRLTGTARRLQRAPTPEPARQVRPPGAASGRKLRRPLGVERKVVAANGTIADALQAADSGDLAGAVAITDAVLAADPLNADAYFVRGMAELGLEDAAAAVGSLRRALYVDPTFGLAAFQLGRAHDTVGDRTAAVRAYGQALRTLDPSDDRHSAILDQVDLGDVAAACRERLRSVSGPRG